MKETGFTGKRRSTTIAATPYDGNSQRKRRSHSRLYLHMRAKCGRGPTVMSKKGSLKCNNILLLL